MNCGCLLILFALVTGPADQPVNVLVTFANLPVADAPVIGAVFRSAADFDQRVNAVATVSGWDCRHAMGNLRAPSRNLCHSGVPGLERKRSV